MERKQKQESYDKIAMLGLNAEPYFKIFHTQKNY